MGAWENSIVSYSRQYVWKAINTRLIWLVIIVISLNGHLFLFAKNQSSIPLIRSRSNYLQNNSLQSIRTAVRQNQSPIPLVKSTSSHPQNHFLQSIRTAVKNQSSIPFTKSVSSFPQDHYLQSIRTAIKQNIKTGKSAKCHYHPIHARQQFFDHKWDDLISNIDKKPTVPTPVLIYSPCMSTYNLGNTLGNYLNEIACAIAANVSIVIGTEIWDYPDSPVEYKGPNSNKNGQVNDVKAESEKPKHEKKYFYFFRALPVVYDWQGGSRKRNLNASDTVGSVTDSSSTINSVARALATSSGSIGSNAAAASALATSTLAASAGANAGANAAAASALAISRVTKHCTCPMYCWSDETAPMWKHMDSIKRIIKEALNQHMEANTPHNGTVLRAYDLSSISNKSRDDHLRTNDLSSINPEIVLPVVPDVAVHYR